MIQRKVLIKRDTKEVKVKGELLIDGCGRSRIDTGNKFLDHMLTLFTFHGLFDLKLKARGDIEVDIHHTSEDIGIALGDAFRGAIGKGDGIRRYGCAYVPMEEVLVRVLVDISGRPGLTYAEKGLVPSTDVKNYTYENGEHLLNSLSKHGGFSLSIGVIKGSTDTHHLLEAIFKALGIAMDQATQIDPRRKGVPSTKGIIDL